MTYDLDSPLRGVQDCPQCQHTMVRLRSYSAVERNEGYLLDDGADRNFITFLLWGWEGVLIKYLYRNVVQPVLAKLLGQQRQDRYARIARAYPNALICTHCQYILKRK
ncbi:MAG TPA: hypothetical protein VFB38_10660 [Chthonomonadaceae bacterium]|nr:hypothetical protein [Chthonomonadaceae bacterium]